MVHEARASARGRELAEQRADTLRAKRAGNTRRAESIWPASFAAMSNRRAEPWGSRPGPGVFATGQRWRHSGTGLHSALLDGVVPARSSIRLDPRKKAEDRFRDLSSQEW